MTEKEGVTVGDMRDFYDKAWIGVPMMTGFILAGPYDDDVLWEDALNGDVEPDNIQLSDDELRGMYPDVCERFNKG